MYLIGAYLGFDNLNVTRIKWFYAFAVGNGITGSSLIISPRHEDPSVRSFKLDTVWKFIADNHLHAICIECLSSEDAMNIPKSFCRKLCFAPYFNRT